MPADLAFLKYTISQLDVRNRVYNLTGSSLALFLALCEAPFLAIEPTEEKARELHGDIVFYREALGGLPVLFLPEANGARTSGERARTIFSRSEDLALVTSSPNLTSPIWSGGQIKETILHLARGQEMGRAEVESILEKTGYRKVPLVTEQGEYSRHGWLIDIFPSTAEAPVRIEFFGDTIDQIRTFEIDTQRSLEEVPDALIFPSGEPTEGTSLLEMMNSARYFVSESLRGREDIPDTGVFLSRYSIEDHGLDAGMLSLQGIGILPRERKDAEELARNIGALMKENRIILVVSSQGQADRMGDILHRGGIIAPLLAREEIFSYDGAVSLSVGLLSCGFFAPGLLVLTEKELFGERPGYRAIRKSRVSKLLTSLDDLRPGDFVVHKDHGIGRFHGLHTQTTEGVKEDLLLIEYEGGRLYIPLQSITRIHKFHAEEGIIPKIDRLGGKTWQQTREKVTRKIQEMAEKLVNLYATREVTKGFSFSADTELHREFDSFFPYEETPDQMKSIEDIKQDMESERPMDRLICGDVGYGKTEVAMRAAFKAVYDGRQVAVLVPTTILCEQHYRTFQSRFAAFPVQVDYLSRFKPVREQKETVKALANGDIDILIGTQSILGRKILFHRLGLLVIDEEHRFGVRQKEKIKELKKGVDVITLTATPIPRTLSMALSDIRDMSLIETPPEERLAVKSVISVAHEELIRDAAEKELARNGQVFFVHNRIRDIGKIAGNLRKLLPAARIAVAHGQMTEKELERVMRSFYTRTVDILVSTAIIGSGLDIPTANTIIINRADTMGLADLYQLRGRVGRGSVRAYAYFLIPAEEIITEVARKRLQALQEMSYLGAGFRLALKDLEIRGAGNLLGTEQSGHIHAVGFDLYMEMLEQAVAEIKGNPIEEDFDPSINLRINALIPEEYIDDMTVRLSTYRKIASCRTAESVQTAALELEDRFGKIPEELHNLLAIMRLKIIAKKLLITKILETDGKIRVLFSPETAVEPADIFALRKNREGTLRFLPDGFEVNLKSMACDNVPREISSILADLDAKRPLLV
ncbi:MAG: transcription-repair coupling factor [Nitrospirota bacterium]